MLERPLLILPPPGQPSQRRRRHSGAEKLHFPTAGRQSQRLGPRFQALETAFQARRTQVRTDPTGIVPEEVLVLETIGSVTNFISAVRRIPGLEWLGEVEEEDLPPDDDFFVQDRTDKPLTGRMYLLFSNLQALQQLQSLWRHWQQGHVLPHGYAVWKDAFTRLRDIRPWGTRDRLEETGVLSDWRERVEHNQERVRGEIELWFRQDADKRRTAESRVVRLVEAAAGRVIRVSTIEDISYHAILTELPVATVRRVLDADEIELVQCEQIQFFRATGQMAAIVDEVEPEAEEQGAAPVEALGAPVAALLDGVPLQNHQRLAGRIILDDPDGLEVAYAAGERVHGTGMASLILHGDLEAEERPHARKLYVRPILRPDPRDWNRPRYETVSEDELVVDLLHRALRRIYEGNGGDPVAPSVRVINLSIGILDRPFENMLSPLARLLDWLSWKYQVLFIVSAGNHAHDIVLEVPRDELRNLAPAQVQEQILKAIACDGRNRRLLSPAEGVNCLTVAALHVDRSPEPPRGAFVAPFVDGWLPSPVNAQGMGFRRSIKPEALNDGGRVVLRQKLGGAEEQAVCELVRSTRPPGQRVAAPGPSPADLGFTCFTRGTSNATALVTRAAVFLYDVLRELRDEPGGALIDTVPEAVWLKVLLMHTADWGPAYGVLDSVLRTPSNSRKFKEYVTRLLGYGALNFTRAISCSPSRATVLSGGSLRADEAQVHRIPLPPSLSGVSGRRRLTITLGWLSPMNPTRQEWRRAHLWFEPPRGEDDPLGVQRQQAEWRAVQRGTVQHEILEGHAATAFVDGREVEVLVNCRAEAGDLDEAVPYGLAVSLEVAEEIGVPIYQEVRASVHARARIAPRP